MSSLILPARKPGIKRHTTTGPLQRAHLSVTDDPDTLAGFARQIERTRAERKNAELHLRRLTTGKGLTEDEIRQVVQSLADAVKLLAGASAEDRRRVYEAA